MKHTYRIKCGKNAGVELRPHRHKNGCYVASKTRFKRHYVFVETLAELERYIRVGYAIRMSAPAIAPSLITRGSLESESGDPM